MRSLWNESDRRSLYARLDRLTADRPALWGRMSAAKMVIHLSDAMRMGTGELPTRPKPSPLRRFPINRLFVYLLPWPKGAPTAPELLSREPGEWAVDIAELRALVEAFARLDRGRSWPDHPMFGTLSPRAWGALGYRHIDHHLRQFGL